jgi:hypothetical protein
LSYNLKIHQGTGRLTGAPLCNSCSFSRIINERVLCNQGWGQNPLEIEEPVRSCNRYYNATLPALSSMEEIAWELKTEGSGHKLGFVPPEKKK